MEGDRSGWRDGTLSAMVGHSSLGQSGVSKAEFLGALAGSVCPRSLVRLPVHSLAGKMKGSEKGGQRKWEPWCVCGSWPNLSTFLSSLGNSLLLPSSFWAPYAFLFSFVHFISVPLLKSPPLRWAGKCKKWNPKLPNDWLVKKDLGDKSWILNVQCS